MASFSRPLTGLVGSWPGAAAVARRFAIADRAQRRRKATRPPKGIGDGPRDCGVMPWRPHWGRSTGDERLREIRILETQPNPLMQNRALLHDFSECALILLR